MPKRQQGAEVAQGTQWQWDLGDGLSQEGVIKGSVVVGEERAILCIWGGFGRTRGRLPEGKYRGLNRLSGAVLGFPMKSYLLHYA